MSALRSILLHLDASPRSAQRLAWAQALAAQHGAQLTALFAVLPALLQYPSAATFSADFGGALQAFDVDRAAAARAVFDQATAGSASPVLWAQTLGEPSRGFVRRALAADLLVLAQRARDDDGSVPADFTASVLIESGRPALVLPYIGVQAGLDGVALVAWKDTPESARALSAALPLLQRARQVHIATWEDKRSDFAFDEPVDVPAYLRLHGVQATWHRQGRASSDIGADLLSLAADLSATLLVMGCYGHGRAREWVLGGASRTVLQSMTLPVLMSH